jgi:hypothetical protein
MSSKRLPRGTTTSRSSSAAGVAINGAADAASSQAAGVTDEQLLAQLLLASSSVQVAAALAGIGVQRTAAVLKLLAGMPKGPAAAAALLECLSPVVAVRQVAA